jgi:putative RecB family exonuclease
MQHMRIDTVEHASEVEPSDAERTSDLPTHPLPGDPHAANRGLETLSPSRAADFKQCPQLFRFRAIDRVEVPPTPSQARGTTAHLALQRLFDVAPPARTPQLLYDLFRAAWAELKPDEFADLFEDVDDERAWGVTSLGILRNYFAIEDPTTFTPVDRELDMLQAIGDITIRGILDRLDESDAGLVITDYKTGKAPPERYALASFFALKIYALLIRERTGSTPVALRLMYLNGPTVYEVPVTDGQLDAMERQLRALWDTINRAISEDHFPPRPGRLCGWCQYRQLCPAFAEPEVDVPASPLEVGSVANPAA